MDSGYILKIEPPKLRDGPDVRCEKKERIGMITPTT